MNIRKYFLGLSVALMGCGLMACSSDSDDGNGSGNGGGTPPGEIESVKGEMPTRTNSMKVYAHFMPWF